MSINSVTIAIQICKGSFTVEWSRIEDTNTEQIAPNLGHQSLDQADIVITVSFQNGVYLAR